jgi:hypothetical protein
MLSLSQTNTFSESAIQKALISNHQLPTTITPPNKIRLIRVICD